MASTPQPLAARLALGEESAFAELYDACADRLFEYVGRRIGCRHAAADIVQATFVRAVQNRKRFARVENPVAYLIQMARNEAVRSLGRKQLQRTQQLSDESVIAAAPSSDDRRKVATAALDRLSPDDRELVELKIYTELTFEEIGQVLGRPAASMASRYRRALESLRPWLTRQLQ